MSTMIDKLLAADAKKITELQTRKYEVKRLTEALGEKFELTLRAIPAQRYAEIQSDAVDMKGGKIGNVDLYKMQIETLAAGIIDPDIKNKELLKHFGAVTPHDLIATLLNPAEITEAAGVVSELCGFKAQKDVDEEVKN
ncbi:phage related protein (plasmid) [Selenomonas ruminantium subsp. lactilytica TAM6421]|uniref:Phage related protein n=1 Tax=Selenomonas ruminantium subsp. lactilytica (strain NBRC 103574 / TAM6421) TaxID=927704 RepID=I0GWR7_SELRL|nr:phage related protein [Selenomonas ruminantium]BAL85204.1 phage related protein [Selenomonas ruminantium subsp. lactilytica TAM6421]